MNLKPVNRIDILEHMNNGGSFKDIMKSTTSKIEMGFIYETIVIICIIVKQLIPNYELISDTKVTCESLIFKPINSIKELLDKSLYSGNNESDLSVKIKDKGWCPFSIKYKNTKGKSDLVECEKYMIEYSKESGEGYSLGYVVKTKSKLTKHHDKGRAEATVIKKAADDNHLFDKDDIRQAYKKFRKILKTMKFTSVNDIIDWIDKEYLNTGRIYLELKFHQALSLKQFETNIKQLKHCLSHKPRSGKTITMLLMAKYLLKNGYKRILIMTSVPATIDSFIKELNKYYEFKDIDYKEQKDYMNIGDSFNGIAFCSVQYLKINYEKKKDQLLLFHCNIFDECHFHSSNKNTFDKIINIQGDKQIMQIFASGTSDKTEWFYDISSKCIYKWTVEDECKMKKYVS